MCLLDHEGQGSGSASHLRVAEYYVNVLRWLAFREDRAISVRGTCVTSPV